MLRAIHRPTLALFLSAAALAACSDQTTEPLAPSGSAANVASADGSGEYLVVFKSSNSIPKDFAAAVARQGGTVVGTMPGIGAAVVGGLTPAGAQALAVASGVESVDADVAIPMQTRRDRMEALASAPAEEIASPTRPDLAGLFAYQWNMAAVNAKPAWLAGKLGDGVTVAILDTGIDQGRPLVGRNNADLQGRVDVARSRSFMPVEDSVVTRLFGASTPAWTDLDGHGTNVASQAVSNAVNFAGVTSRARLMAVKVCTILPPSPTADPGYCSTNSVFQGIYYAVDQGADVINMSLGGGFVKSSCTGCTSIFNRVLHYAKNRGVTVVVSAGNDAFDLDHDSNWYNTYCSISSVICVSATGPVSAGPDGISGPFETPDASSIYTNYGRSAINVAAPGGNYKVGLVNGQPAIVSVSYVLSLCPRWSAGYYDTTAKVAKAYGACGIWGFVGTSQASPHVTGLAALLVQQYGRNPGIIRDVIQASADDLGQSGTDPFYGKGRINVARALGL